MRISDWSSDVCSSDLRVMAVAADGDRFGTGESVITASLPLQVRPSPPRFANFGDAFEMPVVVHNGSDEPTTDAVVLEAGNLTVTGPVGKRVEVPAGDRVEASFPAAVESAGQIGYRVPESGRAMGRERVGRYGWKRGGG